MTSYRETGVEPAARQVRVFVNYRRADTKHVAGRLRDHITARFGRDSVFVDVEDIDPGVDYVKAIDTAVGSCQVMLVLIGEGWLEPRDERGLRRIDDPADRLRIEIEAGLRNRTRVIPVLVDSASMPRAKDLPEPLVPLARHQATRLRHESFRSDADHLLEAVERVARDRFAGERRPPRATKERSSAGLTWLSFGILVMVLLTQLASRDVVRDAVAASRPKVPFDGPWASLVWLLPSLPVLAAAWLVANRRRPGVALGCIAGAAVWVSVSSLFAVWRKQETATMPHLLLLSLLIAGMVSLMAAFPETRQSVRINRRGRALPACLLVGTAVILRVRPAEIAGVLTSTEQSTPSWAELLSRPPFWIALLVPVLIGLPAAVLLFNRVQTTALMTLALLQVLYALGWRLGTLSVDLQDGTTLPEITEDLVFLGGCVCTLLAVWVGQRGSPQRI